MILDEIVEDKKKRLPGHMARIPETEMRRMAEETKTREADCFYNHLKKPGLSIIGELIPVNTLLPSCSINDCFPWNNALA